MKRLWLCSLPFCLLLGAACGSGSLRVGAGASPSPAPSSKQLQAEIGTASPRASIDPNFDFGQFVLVTGSGFMPKQLISAVNKPITWINRTGDVVTVVFDHSTVRSAPIPPGGTWQFVPHTTVSIVYHAEADETERGAIAVQPTIEP